MQNIVWFGLPGLPKQNR